MNRKRYVLTALILVSILLSGCGALAPAATPAPAPASNPVVPVVITVVVQPTAMPVIIQPTAQSVPQNPDVQVVVTPTGMTDIGSLLGDQPVTPQIDGTINWPQLEKMPEWSKKDCLVVGEKCLYVQSGKPNEIDLPNLPGQSNFVVPSGTTLVFGGFTVNLTLGSGKSYDKSNGFYGAITEGTTITSLHIKDGFALLIQRDSGQSEYCMRVVQAINQKWAHENLYRPEAWTDPVCSGIITTVIDPNG